MKILLNLLKQSGNGIPDNVQTESFEFSKLGNIILTVLGAIGFISLITFIVYITYKIARKQNDKDDE